MQQRGAYKAGQNLFNCLLRYVQPYLIR